MSESWRKSAATPRFDAWSSEYEKGVWWRLFFKRLHDLQLQTVGDATGLAVLDVGCGTGALLRRFVDAGASKAAGVDASEGMLKEARRLAGDRDISFVLGPAHELPFEDAAFDVVTTNIAFHHFAEPARVIDEMARVLKDGGTLLICDLNGEGLSGRVMIAHGRRKGDLFHYRRDEIERMMRESGLRVTGSRIVRRFPPAFLVQAVKPTT